MFEFNETQIMIRDQFRNFVEKEIRPIIDDIEYNGVPPYDILRKMFKAFGMDIAAKQQFEASIAKEEAALAKGEPLTEKKKKEKDPNDPMVGMMAAMTVIPIIELSRVATGLVTAMGVSMGLTASAIQSKGTLAQKKKYCGQLLTMEKIGAWAITEPNSGSDAFGSMKSTAKRDGKGGYILNGNKTFITNGPYADTIVFICKLDEPGVTPKDRKIVSFILEKGMKGLVQSEAFKKMGIGSSPTGELFLTDVQVGPEQLLGGSEDGYGKGGAKGSFLQERSGVASMALGIIDRALELSIEYAKTRVQFGQPIGQFQLIQLKLANMEVARLNVQNMVFRYVEMMMNGAADRITLAEASAMKLYSAQAAMQVTTEAVQIFGGAGYMRATRVEQLMRDAKILQIYAGTDEIQITHIAKGLLER